MNVGRQAPTVAEGFDRIETSGLARRIISEKHADCGGKRKPPPTATVEIGASQPLTAEIPSDVSIPVTIPARPPLTLRNTASARNWKHVQPPRTECHAQPHFPCSFGHRDEQNNHDADTTHDKPYRSDRRQEQGHDAAGASAVSTNWRDCGFRNRLRRRIDAVTDTSVFVAWWMGVVFATGSRPEHRSDRQNRLAEPAGYKGWAAAGRANSAASVLRRRRYAEHFALRR